ncbi:MAG: YhjD/YihY/BrkB family envelope integrity protein [Byssovorax sp.]
MAWLRRAWHRFDSSRALGLGAEMAFWLFLSLLPLAAVAGLITARLALGSWSALEPLLRSLPRETQELVGRELGQVAAWNGGQVGLWAGLMFVWLASSGVHSIFDGIELASGAPPRPWWKKRALALVACVALSVGVTLLTLLATGLGFLFRILGSTLPFREIQIESSVSGQIVRLVMGLLISFGLIAGLYWIALPPGPRRSTSIVPGALLAMGLQIVLGHGYGVYIRKVGDGGAYRAGLASIGVTLIALYLFCLVLLIGAQLNQAISNAKAPPRVAAVAARRPPGARPLSARRRRHSS